MISARRCRYRGTTIFEMTATVPILLALSIVLVAAFTAVARFQRACLQFDQTTQIAHDLLEHLRRDVHGAMAVLPSFEGWHADERTLILRHAGDETNVPAVIIYRVTQTEIRRLRFVGKRAVQAAVRPIASSLQPDEVHAWPRRRYSVRFAFERLAGGRPLVRVHLSLQWREEFAGERRMDLAAAFGLQAAELGGS